MLELLATDIFETGAAGAASAQDDSGAYLLRDDQVLHRARGGGRQHLGIRPDRLAHHHRDVERREVDAAHRRRVDREDDGVRWR